MCHVLLHLRHSPPPALLPPEVSVTVEGSTAVRVQWGLIDAACELEPLISVEYQEVGQGAGQWRTVLNRTTLDTNYSLVDGLQPSTLYQFRVGVTSRNGDVALGVSQTVMTLIGEWEGQWVWQPLTVIILV